VLAYYLLSLLLCFRVWISATQIRRKKQAKFIALGSLIPVVVGSITDGILPIMNIQVVELAIPTVTIAVVFILYAMAKYKLMIISPQVAAEAIIATMADFLIVLDFDLNIIKVNQITLDLLGYQEKELIGEAVDKILTKELYFKSVIYQKLLKEKFIRDCPIEFVTKGGSIIPVSFSGSVVRDEEGDVLGIVCVSRESRRDPGLVGYLRQEKMELETKVASLEKEIKNLKEKTKD